MSSWKALVQLPPDLLEPASFAGTGDAVIELPYVTSVGVALTFENAEGFVSVRSLSSDGEIVEYLISAIDPYSGTACICDFYHGAVAAIQIESDSSWALEVSDLRDRPVFSGSASGVGDEVLLVGVPAGPLTASYAGDGNFIIWSWAAEGRDLLVNEIGDFSGTVQLPDAVFITIAASEGGAWSLESGGASDLG